MRCEVLQLRCRDARMPRQPERPTHSMFLEMKVPRPKRTRAVARRLKTGRRCSFKFRVDLLFFLLSSRLSQTVHRQCAMNGKRAFQTVRVNERRSPRARPEATIAPAGSSMIANADQHTLTRLAVTPDQNFRTRPCRSSAITSIAKRIDHV